MRKLAVEKAYFNYNPMPENIIQAYANIKNDNDQYVSPEEDCQMSLENVANNCAYLCAHQMNYCILSTCYKLNAYAKTEREINFIVNIAIFLYRLSRYTEDLPLIKTIYDDLCSIDNKLRDIPIRPN